MTSTLARHRPLSLRLVTDETASAQTELSLSLLTRGMREGSDEAWAEFHRYYYFSLLHYAAGRASQSSDAPEIVQQTYLRIARHIKAFDNDIEFRRWLICVVRCVARDHQRGNARRLALLEKFAHWQEHHRDAVESPDVAADSVAHEALTKLPPDDAHLLRLKYYEDWSVEQLAAAAHTTSKTIENRLARLRQRLREIIPRIR